MNRLYQFKISAIILTTLLVVTTFIFSKSFYMDGNYSEYGGCTRMCMRCHMGKLYSPGIGPPTMSLSASKTTVRCGDTITLTVKITNFSPAWNPGIGIFVDINSLYAAHIPQEIGWEVLSNSNGNQFSYIRPQTKDSTFIWQVKAPQLPGSYRIATSGYFADYSSGKTVKSTKRGDNSLLIQVNPVKDNTLFNILSVSSKYKNFVFLEFNKPVDTAEITNKTKNTKVSIANISRSRNGKTITLQTDDLSNNFDYSIFAGNLKDCALQQNMINPVPIDFRADLSSPYRIYAEWSMDATVDNNNDMDMTEYVGKIDGIGICRSDFIFFLPQNMQDLLPITNFKSAKLHLTQQHAAITANSGTTVNWDVHKFLPNANDYVGNTQASPASFSGFNEQNPPIASLNQKIPTGDKDTNWSWDITTDFLQRFKNLGGNPADYFLRLQASDENNINDGVGFYGSDADSDLNKPYIELSFDTGINSVENTKILNDNINLQIIPNIGNELSVIYYQLSESGFIKLSIINMLGQEISVLKQEFEETGNYYYPLSIGNYQLNSGMYFIRLSASGQVSTSKIIVIK